MRFQNVFGVFVDFLNSVVPQAKRILFDSNKIRCLVLSYSELTAALIKKKPDCEAIGFQKNKLWEIKYGNHKNSKECRDFLPLWS